MSITKDQQQALNDALVPRDQRLWIGIYNYRLSTSFKPKEPTFQIALDALSLTPFYPAFLISASVPAIYMHEFWTTASHHKQHIEFKLNKKNLPFEEEILDFIRQLGYSGDIKSLSDVSLGTLHQPWRTFRTIINKCLSGKSSSLDQICISQAQIMWESGAYKAYYGYATGKLIQKPEYLRKSTREKSAQSPNASPAKTEQIKGVTRKSKTDYRVSHTSGSGTNEGTGVTPGVPDEPTYDSKDEQISWKSSKEDDDYEIDDDLDEDSEQTESENDGDDFVHPKISNHDGEETRDGEDQEEECFNQVVHTPSQYESSDDEAFDDITQGGNVEEDQLNEEKTNE
ncbi:hypothetical protein Tco_1438829 [Tanacetum coccineum]